MPLVASDSGGSDFEPAPAGTHVARCVQVIDLGTQFSEKWGKSAAKVLLGWELPEEWRPAIGERPEGPHLVWCRYTCSLHKKAKLREVLEAWRGKPFNAEELRGFDLRNLLDKPCMINITHNEHDGKTYANVSGVMKPPKATVVPDRISDLVFFSITDWDSAAWDTFSENLQNTIKQSSEYKAIYGKASDQYSEPIDVEADDESRQPDDIPF